MRTGLDELMPLVNERGLFMSEGARRAFCPMRLVALVAAVACSVTFGVARPPAASAAGVQSKINALIRDAIGRHGIRAVIFQATKNGRTIMTKAYGNSQTGVPVTTNMHFRNGAVAISYMSTLLLRLVDEGKVKLDDKISKWLPNLRDSNRVTLRMLASMTAGYHDYEIDPALIPDRLYNNPFVTITTQYQLKLALDEPQQFTPGTNFSYAHSNYVILGLILSKITKLPLDVALSRMVLRPLGLKNTVASIKPPIPLPALHAYSGERGPFFNIPLRDHFFEDSTYWNPSWTLAHGAIETTDIADMTRTAIGIGSGRLLSRRLYREQIDPHIGFGHPAPTCERCMKLNRYYGYGIGLVTNGGRGQWLLQNPLFAGEAAVESYLPSHRISIAIVTTFKPTAYNAQGNPSPYWQVLWAKIGKVLAPRDAPAVPPGVG